MRARTGLLTIGGVIALTVGGGTAYATIAASPVSSGVVYGCYTNAAVNGSHALVLQNAGTPCPNGTTAVSWNQTGPAGAAGAIGPAGPTGPPGATGATGLTGAAGPPGPIGLTGPTGATGGNGPPGAAGATGNAGPAGSPGQAGTNGTNGTSVVTSSGSPTGTCTAGDTDIDITSGEVWTCTPANTWTDTGSSFAGPAGQNGTNGTSVLTSSGSPTGTCTAGDTDIDITSGEVWTCTPANTWMDTGSSIAGPAGAGASVSTLSSGDTNCPNGGASITDGKGNTAYACNGTNGSSSGPLGQLASSVYSTAPLTVTNQAAMALVPGLTDYMTVPANSLVYISAEGGAQTESSATDGFSVIGVSLLMDSASLAPGNNSLTDVVTMANTTGTVGVTGHWSLSTAQVFPTGGTYGFEVGASGLYDAGGSTATVGAAAGNLLQGTLSVLVLHE
jgi:collagen type VII alpha